MVCMLAPKLAAVCPDTTDDAVVEWLRGKGIELVPVSYRDTMKLGCNVVALGNDRSSRRRSRPTSTRGCAPSASRSTTPT